MRGCSRVGQLLVAHLICAEHSLTSFFFIAVIFRANIFTALSLNIRIEIKIFLLLRDSPLYKVSLYKV